MAVAGTVSGPVSSAGSSHDPRSSDLLFGPFVDDFDEPDLARDFKECVMSPYLGFSCKEHGPRPNRPRRTVFIEPGDLSLRIGSPGISL